MHLFYREEKKIAAPLALLLLIVLLSALVFVIKKVKTVSTQAQKTGTGAVMVTNLTYRSASIVWQTTDPQVGWVIYGENQNKLTETGLDDRQDRAPTNRFQNHHVTLKNLKSNTVYFFKAATAKQIIASYNQTPFSFKTAARFDIQTNLRPAFGRAVEKNGAPLQDGLVILKIDAAETLSTFTKTTGEWLIPLQYLTDRKTGRPFEVSPQTPVTIQIKNGQGETAEAVTTVDNIDTLSQPIIIGQTLNFKAKKPQVLAGKTSRPADLPDAAILLPKEGAIIPGRRPLIKGTAAPETMIALTIKAVGEPSRRFEVKSDEAGVWRLPLSQDLPSKHHLITAELPDKNGKTKLIKRQFTIAQSGEAVLGEATPAATVAPTPKVAPTTPLTTPTPTIAATPPVTGINDFSLPLAGASLLILGLGLILLF